MARLNESAAAAMRRQRADCQFSLFTEESEKMFVRSARAYIISTKTHFSTYTALFALIDESLRGLAVLLIVIFFPQHSAEQFQIDFLKFSK